MKLEKDQFDAIAYIFETANGNTLDNFENGIIDASGLKDIPPQELVDAILDIFSEVNPDNAEYRLSCYWALSKRFDKNLLSFFRKQLKFELEVEGAPGVFQLLIALDNLTEPAFGVDRNGSYAGIDSELNIRDAKAYLGNL
ncbi:MAG: hypothetical protein GY763_13905 [Gammaproteobacteria bacterium]|nr:hypothetical protein [Gammaproteobacteria bacterium]